MSQAIHTSPVLIIGGGPAGYTAAIYAARANLQPILVQGPQPGGQLTITTDVENYPGFEHPIQGPWLMAQMEAQAIHMGTKVIFDTIADVDFSQQPFKCRGDSGDTYVSQSVIIATGAQAKWLGIPSENTYRGFGVSACATCDGFFFKGQDVVVVGGGNTAVEEALYLTHHARHVTLVHRRDSLRAEKILQQRLLSHPKVSVIWNRQIREIIGEENPTRMTGVVLETPEGALAETVAADGLFVAIGHSPATQVFHPAIKMDEGGYILTSEKLETSVPGVYAAGDVQDKIYRQAVTAAGQGCMAALEVERFLAHLE